jgi:hypothetical protein
MTKLLLNHGVERKRLTDQHLNGSLGLVRQITNQNTTGQRIRRGFFDTRFAFECSLDGGRQSLIPF